MENHNTSEHHTEIWETMNDTNKSLKETTRQGISSLETGLRILKIISESPAAPNLKMLSDQLDMSSSLLHKYLVSLLRMDFIKQVNNSRYELSTQSLTLGISAIRRIDPIQLTIDAATHLQSYTDKTVSVTIWNGQFPLVIHWLDSSRPVSVNVRLGTQLSPFFSASGRLFLAHLPLNRRYKLIENFYTNPIALPRHQGKLLDKSSFIEHLEIIKDNNYCSFYGDFLPDINVVSSAVFDLNGKIPTVISLMGMAGDTPVEEGCDFHKFTLQIAESVTRRLCGRDG